MKNILKAVKEEIKEYEKLLPYLVHLKEANLIEIKEEDDARGYQLIETNYCIYSFDGYLPTDDPTLEGLSREVFEKALMNEKDNYFFVRFKGNQTRLFPYGEKAKKLWSYLKDIPYEYFSFSKKEDYDSNEFSLAFPFVSKIRIRFNFNNMTVSFWRNGKNTVCSSKEEVHDFYNIYLKEHEQMVELMTNIKSHVETSDPTSFLNISSERVFLNGKSTIFRLQSGTIYHQHEWRKKYCFSMGETDITVIEHINEFKEKVSEFFTHKIDEFDKRNPKTDVASLYLDKFFIETFGTEFMRTGLMDNQVSRQEFKKEFEHGYRSDEIHVLTKKEVDAMISHYQHEYMNRLLDVVCFRNYVLILFFSGPYPFLEIYVNKHKG